MRLHIETEVPVARGWDRAPTCVVAGIMAAAALTGHTVDRAELVRIATAVEGHPTTLPPRSWAAPWLLHARRAGYPRRLRYEVSAPLRFITVIPPTRSTPARRARSFRRRSPSSAAVWQMGRIAGMTRGLETGDLALIADANDDRLQEPYRRALIPDYDAIRRTCLDGGAGTLWISGSGSTLMAVTDDTIVAKFLQVRLREGSRSARRISLPAIRRAPRSSTCHARSQSKARHTITRRAPARAHADGGSSSL